MTNEPAAPREGRLLRAGAVGFAGSTVGAILAFTFTLTLARALGTVGAGLVLQATAVFLIAMALAKGGLDTTVVYLLPRLRAQAMKEIPGTVGLALSVSATLGAVCAVAVGAGTPLLDDSDLESAIRYSIWALPLGAATLVGVAALRALGDVANYVVISQILIPGLRPVAVLLVAVFGLSPEWASLGWALPFVVALPITVVMLRRTLAVAHGSPALTRLPNRATRSEAIRFAGGRVVATSLEQALIWLDVLLVGSIAGAGAAGVYGTAARFVAAGLIVDTALRLVLAPEFSRLIAGGEVDRLRSTYRKGTVILVLLSWPIYILLAVFAPLLLSWLGEGFEKGAVAMAILCGATAVTLTAGNVYSLLFMSGHSGLAAVNKAIVVAINVVGNVLTVPVWGINAAAAVWAISMVTDAALASLQARHFTSVALPLKSVMYAGTVVLICVGLPAAVTRLLLGPTGLAMGTATLVGGTVLALWVALDSRRLEAEQMLSLIRARLTR